MRTVVELGLPDVTSLKLADVDELVLIKTTLAPLLVMVWELCARAVTARPHKANARKSLFMGKLF